MAQRNRPTKSSSESSAAVVSSLSVSMTPDQWRDTIAMIEFGVKAIGTPAFVLGGQLIQEIERQLNSQPQAKEI